MDPDRHTEGPPRAILGILAAFAALLFLFQYTTLAKFGVLPPARRHATLDSFINDINQLVDLTTFDLLLALLIVGLFVAIALSHLLKGSLSELTAWCLATERRAVITLLCLATVSVRFYFATGEISWAADSTPHRSYAWVASQAIAEGELPIWTNYFGAGSPFCQFYGFLYFYLTGVAHFLLRDVDTSIKLSLALGHIVSGLTMYAFCRSRGARRGYAIVG